MPLAGALAILLAAGEAVLDWMTWVELDVSALYIVPLVLAAVARSSRLLWALAIGLVLMTIAAYAAQIPPALFSFHEPFFINRVMSAVALTVSAALCHVWIMAARQLAAQQKTLMEQKAELERLHQVAEDANRRKTQVLTAVSHDIRNPLAIIDLAATVIERSAENPAVADQIPEFVQRLRQNVRVLTDLVLALVDVSALESGRISVNKSIFNLNDLLVDEHQRLQELAQAKRLAFAVEVPASAVWLRTDRVKLTRILSNLIANAIKFTEVGGIKLSGSLMENGVPLIRVEDSGVGISPENLGRIFEEYGQLGNPERDHAKGWGLGLAISKRLADALGATISVESQPNRGTTFTLLLPDSAVSQRSEVQAWDLQAS